ncbi:hypothetical protein [Chromobacterium sp. ATCC 53434]|uniref:hypothetical protein n=1 Tax=Chromobacterium sp. (strain ATCC 53434 / SC 14030) TaxID=2059672 RepID=UPI00130511DB|nr:hypothetical protein [Chromobacterium sp. ATCC 53434]
MALDYERHNKQRWPHGKLVAEPGRMLVNNTDLVKLTAACHLRLSERMSRIAG